MVGLVLILCLSSFRHAAAQEEFDFDVSAFERKPFEIRGYLEGEPEYGKSNTEGALYQLSLFDEEQPDTLKSFGATMELDGRIRSGDATFAFRTHNEFIWSNLGQDDVNELYEGFLTIQPNPSFAFDIGKRVNRWGKGVAWNPVAFVERAKDAGDPDMSREGYVMAGFDWIRSFEGPLQAIAFTPLVVPVQGPINTEFGEEGHLNPAGKVYVLYRDTDFDFMFLTEGSRTARYGIDFSRNLKPNFEIHGELAYITDVTRRLISPNCTSAGTKVEDAISYLVGLRYRTESDITFTLEQYYNGAGNSKEQQQQFYECVHQAVETGDNELLGRLPIGKDLDRGPYTRPNPMRWYLHFKAVWSEPFNILYFDPGVQLLYNLRDNSFAVSPELLYTGVENLELRLRASVPVGDRLTEWGEKPADYRVELRVRYYF